MTNRTIHPPSSTERLQRRILSLKAQIKSIERVQKKAREDLSNMRKDVSVLYHDVSLLLQGLSQLKESSATKNKWAISSFHFSEGFRLVIIASMSRLLFAFYYPVVSFCRRAVYCSVYRFICITCYQGKPVASFYLSKQCHSLARGDWALGWSSDISSACCITSEWCSRPTTQLGSPQSSGTDVASKRIKVLARRSINLTAFYFWTAGNQSRRRRGIALAQANWRECICERGFWCSCREMWRITAAARWILISLDYYHLAEAECEVIIKYDIPYRANVIDPSAQRASTTITKTDNHRNSKWSRL